MASVNLNVPPQNARAAESPRVDLVLIAEMVNPGARVLDIGCGDGTLLRLLAAKHSVDGRGIEISQAGVNSCVAQGLAVIQGDADTDLVHYPDLAFDYAILSQTIQATYSPRHVLEQLLRIGRRAIVSFPNFGHWSVRTRLLFGGKMPRTDNLPDRFPDADAIIMAHRAGLRIGEVPVRMFPPPDDDPMHGGVKAVYYAFNMLFSIAMTVLRRDRINLEEERPAEASERAGRIGAAP